MAVEGNPTMISLQCSLGQKSLALLAVLIVCLLPAAVRAENIIIKNATSAQLVVTVSYAARGQIVPGQPNPLAPGAATPGISVPGNKIIMIANAAAPARPICPPIVIPAAMQDQYLDIVVSPNGKVGVVPGTPPKAP
jgi:hypothetical protein